MSIESANPRARRAHADAMLAKAGTSGTQEDYLAARQAVFEAGTSRRAQSANFYGRLAAVALRHQPTNTLVTAARRTIDTAATPAFGDRIREQGYCSPGLQFGQGAGGVLLRWEYVAPDETGCSAEVPEHMRRWGDHVSLVWDGDFESGQREAYHIPLNQERTDVSIDAVRMLPEETSERMAWLTMEATEPWTGHYWRLPPGVLL